MFRSRLAIPALLLSFCLSWAIPPIASAVLGDSLDVVGGDGQLAPTFENQGVKLTEIFREGVQLLADGKCKRAEKKFEAVLEKVPRNSDTNYLRGVALQCQHKYKKALRYFKHAKRDDANYYIAYEKLGVSYLAIGGMDEAKGELLELTRIADACGDRCPMKLLKAKRKLAEAIARFEGVEVVPAKAEKPRRRFDPIRTSAPGVPADETAHPTHPQP